MAYRHLLFAGVMAVTVALVIVLRRAERSERHSFSMHAAQSRASYLTFALGLTVATLCWSAWMTQWFVPRFHPGWVFTSVYFTALGLMFIAAWVRWEKGVQGKIHDIAAYGMASLMPIVPAVLVMQTHFPMGVRYVCGAVCAVQIMLLCLLIFIPAMRGRFLVYQLAYIVLTFTALLTVTYA